MKPISLAAFHHPVFFKQNGFFRIGENRKKQNLSHWLPWITGCVLNKSGFFRPGETREEGNQLIGCLASLGVGCVWNLSMALFGTGVRMASLVSRITASVAIVKAGGTVSGTILAGSRGLNLLAQTALGSGASALGSSLGALKVGTILSACPASVLAVGPSAAKATVAVLGGAMTVAAVPPVLSAVGFTGAGIAASSLAAKMMSLSAIANGGGVAAGGLVATLQSVGAAGLSMSSKLLLGSAGSILMAQEMGI
ncbi:interferon alpha-inducible protein 27-like protein 2B isoform X1 [Cricetulus griseus]|uniref:interferon alpha-inducible protein 27-like protein 2B isoform X1 n=1 Tax=Cricetulus griseus TaxID=10029 RepID=UPI00045475F1|nr:interferon alpha-inducible protein 27-like protein 2B isoform X1 [Cricetulus griseus]